MVIALFWKCFHKFIYGRMSISKCGILWLIIWEGMNITYYPSKKLLSSLCILVLCFMLYF